MARIGRSWNGRIFGTNTGNVAVTLDGEDEALTGTIRLSDDKFGIAVYRAVGKFSSGELSLVGNPEDGADDALQLGEVTVSGSLTAEGRIDGKWETTLGTGGTFQLWPHNFQARPDGSGIPEQVNTATKSLGAVRLDASDVRRLVGQLTKDFTNKRPVVTFFENGNEKNVYFEDFESILDNLPELRYLKISVQEPEMYGINRLSMVEFSAAGENIIRVQGVQESWALGKAETLSNHLEGYKRTLATQFRKFGLSINLVLQIFTLAALPGLAGFGKRAVFVSAMFGVQACIVLVHRRYIPNFVLFPAGRRPALLGRLGAGISSWTITSAGAVIAAIIYGLLKGELGKSPLMSFVAHLWPF